MVLCCWLLFEGVELFWQEAGPGFPGGGVFNDWQLGEAGLTNFLSRLGVFCYVDELVLDLVLSQVSFRRCARAAAGGDIDGDHGFGPFKNGVNRIVVVFFYRPEVIGFPDIFQGLLLSR